MSSRLFVLGPDRQAVLEAIRNAQDGWTVELGEPRRNAEQNALLHALLTEVARSKQWAGKYHDVSTWKRLCTAAWIRAEGRHATVLPAIDGQGVDVIYEPTSRMTKAQVASLIDYIQSWMYDPQTSQDYPEVRQPTA